MEDYLGAGAILSYLEGEKSPEAEVCMGAFLQAEPKLDALIWDSGSSRELRERGFAADVEHCSRLNVYQSVPILKDNLFVTYKGEL
jgi:2-phosphosulfolactate phosphatase